MKSKPLDGTWTKKRRHIEMAKHDDLHTSTLEHDLCYWAMQCRKDNQLLVELQTLNAIRPVKGAIEQTRDRIALLKRASGLSYGFAK